MPKPASAAKRSDSLSLAHWLTSRLVRDVAMSAAKNVGDTLIVKYLNAKGGKIPLVDTTDVAGMTRWIEAFNRSSVRQQYLTRFAKALDQLNRKGFEMAVSLKSLSGRTAVEIAIFKKGSIQDGAKLVPLRGAGLNLSRVVREETAARLGNPVDLLVESSIPQRDVYEAMYSVYGKATEDVVYKGPKVVVDNWGFDLQGGTEVKKLPGAAARSPSTFTKLFRIKWNAPKPFNYREIRASVKGRYLQRRLIALKTLADVATVFGFAGFVRGQNPGFVASFLIPNPVGAFIVGAIINKVFGRKKKGPSPAQVELMRVQKQIRKMLERRRRRQVRTKPLMGRWMTQQALLAQRRWGL